MTTYVAFLAGINVGNRRVSMARLKEAFETLGYGECRTFIASGNVIFTNKGSASAMAAKISAGLEGELGFSVNVFIRSASELCAAVDASPFTRAKPEETVAIGFMAKAPTAAQKKATEALSTEQDILEVIGKELHWHARGGLGRTSIKGTAMTKALGQPFTVRNINSLRKLVELLES